MDLDGASNSLSINVAGPLGQKKTSQGKHYTLHFYSSSRFLFLSVNVVCEFIGRRFVKNLSQNYWREESLIM